MERREFLAVAGALALASQPAIAATPQDEAATKQLIIDWYKAFANPSVDRTFYRSFMTADYLLLENGVLLDKEGDVAMLDAIPADRVRHDAFDFQRIVVEGDRAWLVYFLKSEMTEPQKGRRSTRYLESALLRREAGTWRVCMLHSTKISPPEA